MQQHTLQDRIPIVPWDSYRQYTGDLGFLCVLSSQQIKYKIYGNRKHIGSY